MDTLHGKALAPISCFVNSRMELFQVGTTHSLGTEKHLTLHSQWEGMYQVHHINPRDPN